MPDLTANQNNAVPLTNPVINNPQSNAGQGQGGGSNSGGQLQRRRWFLGFLARALPSSVKTMKRRAILLLLAALASLALPMCQSTPGAGGGGAAAEMERLYATWTKNENRFDAADHERLSPNQEISPEKELALMYDGRITGEKEFWQHFIQDRQQRGRKKAEQDLRRIVRAHGVSTIMSFAYGRGVVGPEAFDKIVQESQDNQTAFYRYINRPEVPLDGVGSYFKQAHPTVSATVY